MKIGLDFDGVISNCGKLKCDAARKLFGVDIPAERFKKELVVDGGLLTLEQYRDLQYQIYATRELGMLMEPVAGMLHILPRLIADGHYIKIITSRDGVQLDVAKEWSATQGLALDFIGVGFGLSKAGAAAGFDLFVDDDLDKLAQLIDVVPHRLLFSWGYNAHIDASGIAERVSSWDELAAYVQRS